MMMHSRSPGRQPAAGGHARLAAGRQTPVSHARPSPGSSGGSRPAPFADQWPLRTFLELGALPEAVRCARLHARLTLLEWGLAAISDSTELVVSELVTNGVRASRAAGREAVRMWLVSDRAHVVVFAWDASPQRPGRADPGAHAESGRGLLLVEAISERWGHFAYDSEGKVVWAALPV